MGRRTSGCCPGSLVSPRHSLPFVNAQSNSNVAAPRPPDAAYGVALPRVDPAESQTLISAALWIVPPARVARTSSADSVCSSADSVSWARSAPSVRHQHRGAEEDRQHQEREAGCRPVPEHAIDAFDRFAQSEGRASRRPDHRDEDLSHRDALAILLGRWGARPGDARFKACPAACSKDGEQFSDHVLPAMYDLYPGACTHVPSVPKDHPHEATGDLGDLGDLGGLGDPRARSRRWRTAGGLDLIGMSRVRRLPSAKHTYVVV